MMGVAAPVEQVDPSPGSRLRPLAVVPPPEDALLGDMVGAKALAIGLETGLIDVVAAGTGRIADIARRCGMPAEAAERLVGLLCGSGALLVQAGHLRASPALAAALEDRDRVVQKLAFLDLAARDVAEHLDALLFDPPRFLHVARSFGLFRYDCCLTPSAADLATTRRWVAYTSALTRFEAAAVLPFLGIGDRRRLLDVGGNSGAFAAALCRAYPGLSATVFDLPAVAMIGEAEIAASGLSDRIAFRSGDARRDPWPGGHDIVSFKSMLHDWPAAEAIGFLDRAIDALEPGGRVLVFERGAFDWSGGPIPYRQLANLVFAPFYRDPDLYADHLAARGLKTVTVRRIDLDMPFHLVEGERR